MRILFIPRFVFLVVSFSIGAALAQPQGDPDDYSGLDIIDGYLWAQEVLSEMAYMKMTVIGADGKIDDEKRLLGVFRFNEDGSTNYMVRLLAPEDVRGVTVLTHQPLNAQMAKQYLYLPSVGKTRELTPTTKSRPFLNSDYSLEDLQRELPSAHTYERLDDDMVDGTPCFVVRAVETDKAAGSAYNFRDLYIDRATYDLLKVAYHGRDDKLVKTLYLFEYRSPEVKGITKRPYRAVMESVSGSSTVFTMLEARIDEGIEAEVFRPESIENWTEDAVDAFIYDKGLSLEE